METIYLNLDARRITVCGDATDQRACVGQEAVCYTVLPRRKTPAQGGKVLDFETCRQALEGTEQEAVPAEVSAPEEAPRPRRRPDLALAADLIASAGMVAAVAAVAVRFFLG